MLLWMQMWSSSLTKSTTIFQGWRTIPWLLTRTEKPPSTNVRWLNSCVRIRSSSFSRKAECDKIKAECEKLKKNLGHIIRQKSIELIKKAFPEIEQEKLANKIRKLDEAARQDYAKELDTFERQIEWFDKHFVNLECVYKFLSPMWVAHSICHF